MKKETLKNTTNSRIYKMLFRRELWDYHGLCPICPPNGGCNSWNKYKNNGNWKKYRKTQWKEMK